MTRYGHTPAEVIEIINKEINAGLADPKLQARLVEHNASSPICMASRIRCGRWSS